MTLTLDVLSNVDYGKIQAEVEKIKSNLNKIPQKITIDIDVAIAKNATQKIENIWSGIESVVRNAGSSTALRSTAKDIDAVAQSAANMGRTTSTALRDQIDALTGVSNQAKSARDNADAMKMAWATQTEESKKAAEQAKKSADAEKLVTKTRRDSATAITKGTKALNNWTKMAKSSDKTARESYGNLRSIVNELRTYASEFDGSAESTKKLADATARFNTELKQTEAIGVSTGTACKTLGDRLSDLGAKFASRLTATQAVMFALRSIKSAAKEAIAVNDSMTQLRIVTNESEDTYQRYGESVAKTAQKIGSSMTDIIDATTVFARLGYSLDESSTLAELAAMLQRVGDIDADEAQASLTSIIKAFDLDVSDMELVMDKLVTVGNNFPISVSEIASGMMNASSALAAAGNSFDKSVALLAAANTTLQDANKASTGLRTITARIRKTDSELDDLGEAMTSSAYSELVGALTKYNVALQDANGEYRDTYDIMQDIANVWDQMSSSEQAALAELAAGNRQQTVFYSIIQNFNEVAAESLKQMEGSSGEMQKSYDEWMNSISAHIETFKAAFQGLSSDLISSGLLTGFIDIGTAIINVVDAIVRLNDNLGTTAVTIGSLVAVVNSIKSIS